MIRLLKFSLLLFGLISLSTACRPKAEEASKFEKKDGMVRLPGGTFQMGSSGVFETPHGTKEFPEEAPVRTVTVKGFWIDESEVTNRQFAEFVKATSYVTFAEREAKLEDFPVEAHASLPPLPFRQGSVIFVGDSNLTETDSWWRWDPEANWRHPSGAGSSIENAGDHPVVCVSHEDAAAYAKWAGKRLPTEAEWEYAARGGLTGKIYAWGDELKPGDRWMANTFQGEFPKQNSAADGFISTAPVNSFPANGFGLFDMSGNVWEICDDLFNSERPIRHVIKGGSYLCHVSYCMRYRPAARHSMEDGSPANHTGFRCVRD